MLHAPHTQFKLFSKQTNFQVIWGLHSIKVNLIIYKGFLVCLFSFLVTCLKCYRDLVQMKRNYKHLMRRNDLHLIAKFLSNSRPWTHVLKLINKSGNYVCSYLTSPLYSFSATTDEGKPFSFSGTTNFNLGSTEANEKFCQCKITRKKNECEGKKMSFVCFWVWWQKKDAEAYHVMNFMFSILSKWYHRITEL